MNSFDSEAGSFDLTGSGLKSISCLRKSFSKSGQDLEADSDVDSVSLAIDRVSQSALRETSALEGETAECHTMLCSRGTVLHSVEVKLVDDSSACTSSVLSSRESVGLSPHNHHRTFVRQLSVIHVHLLHLATERMMLDDCPWLESASCLKKPVDINISHGIQEPGLLLPQERIPAEDL